MCLTHVLNKKYVHLIRFYTVIIR